ncbi:hypothetical protein A2841_01150 [Candidatus Kaiserbacteria bacterium RIFCSPHIGHO2_01_FULL_48_10]|uniref:Uncharacterized protein n=1 Tax=Candidatus Kaiserbacteria bacterium RIFCSPHIGHO2_01_FULL_48_10 TaxID=1798476 RepID=A0A1F6C5Z1_9BACT|nr:MAG: hypothetical protein A2841_01150 [Candidatus Kaiserbacteria bacterium RIFCSPHIGHO2_01_FULL_48_10]
MSDDPQSVPDVPVDQALAQRVMELYQQVDQLLDDLRVPDEERKEVEQNLMEAIAADLLVRLGERLSDEDKQDLAALGGEGKEPDLNLVAGFFRDKFSQEELVQALAEATESVLKEFADAMR